MLQAFDRLVLDPAKRWFRPFFTFTSAQTAAQVIGAITGIIIVRNLTKQDYAFYTIANSVLSSLVVLADGSIGNALVGIGGQIWEDKHKLGQAIRAGLGIRAFIRNVFALPVLIVLVWLLWINGSGIAEIIYLTPVVLLGATLSLANGIYAVAPRLMGHVRLLQTITLAAAGFRLFLATVLAFLGLNAVSAMCVVLAGYLLQFLVSYSWTRRQVEIDLPADPDVSNKLMAIIKRQIPNSLYYVLQSQIGIWLLSVFGTPDRVADLGALSRISIIYVALLAAAENVLIPAYARCRDPARLPIIYLQILASMVAISLIPILITWIFPGPILWFLGPQYEQLPVALLFATVAGMISTINSTTYLLNTTRGWIPPPWIYISTSLGFQGLLLYVIGASTIIEVLLVTIIFNLVQIIVNIGGTLRLIIRLR
jgi:O-antigen/teichoic acid export membrane protein